MPEFTHSQLLRRKIEIFSPRLDQASAAFWYHAELPKYYPAYLCANHSVVRASMPLMRAALDSALARANREPASAALAAYLARHVPEETHHDEWLLDDLEAIGLPRSLATTRMPSATAARLAGAQYFWIFHYHPIAVLGYIAVLEGTPPDLDFIRQTASRSGVPLEAFSNLTYHARLDPTHKEDLDRALDQMPLTAEHHAAMGVSAIHTIAMLTQLMEEVFSMGELRNREPSPGFQPATSAFY